MAFNWDSLFVTVMHSSTVNATHSLTLITAQIRERITLHRQMHQFSLYCELKLNTGIEHYCKNQCPWEIGTILNEAGEGMIRHEAEDHDFTTELRIVPFSHRRWILLLSHDHNHS